MEPIRVEGEKIVLRSVDSSDIDTLLLWENANNEPLYGVFEEQYSREDVVQFIENQQRYSIAETEQLRLMICSHEGERLGSVDLTEYDGEKAFVSILIVGLDNRRKGRFALGSLKPFIYLRFEEHDAFASLVKRYFPIACPAIYGMLYRMCWEIST